MPKEIFLCHGCKHAMLNIVQPQAVDQRGHPVILPEVAAPWCNVGKSTICVQLRIKACERFEPSEISAEDRVKALEIQAKGLEAGHPVGLGLQV